MQQQSRKQLAEQGQQQVLQLRRSPKRPHAGSLHLDIRLSALNTDDGDDGEDQNTSPAELQQQQQHRLAHQQQLTPPDKAGAWLWLLLAA